jgi:hypothetical protein
MNEPLYRTGQVSLPGMIATWIEVHTDRVLQLEDPSSIRNLGGPGISKKTTVRTEVAMADIKSAEPGQGGSFILIHTATDEHRFRCPSKEREAVIAAITSTAAGDEIPDDSESAADDAPAANVDVETGNDDEAPAADAEVQAP